MATLGFAAEIAAAGAFWLSHLLFSYTIRKYKHKCIRDEPVEVSRDLPCNGTLLMKVCDGGLVSIPEGVPVISVNYGDGPSVHEVKGGGVIMGTDEDGIRSIVYSGVGCDCYSNNSVNGSVSTLSYDSSDESFYKVGRSKSF